MQLFYEQLFDENLFQNGLNQSHRVKFEKLILLRLILFIFLTLVIIDTNLEIKTFPTNFLYLTLWGAYISYIFFALSLIENLSFYWTTKQFFHKQLWQFTQFCFILGFSFQVPIFLMFWLYVYPRVEFPTIRFLLLNICQHGGIFACIIIDFLLNDIPFISRFSLFDTYSSHAILIVFVSSTYAVVNASYVFITGIAIYPGVTWNNIATFIMVPSTLLVALGSFYLGKLTYDKIKVPRMEEQFRSFSLPLKQ